MSRLHHLAAVIAVALLGATTAGCGGTAVVDAAPAPEATVASPTAHRTAGWAPPAAARGSRPGRLSDDFRVGASLRHWGYFEGDYGRNRFRVRDGVLEVVPPRSAWVDAHRGFYLYRDVRGDFDVRARVRVTGRDGGRPRADRSLSGLLVRAAPATDGDPESWLALRAGTVDGRQVLERKDTQRSRSRHALVDRPGGWVQLRIVRDGSRFSLLARPDGEGAWRRRGTFVRADLPRTLQVGIDASSGAGSPRADLRSQVDWVRFAAPAG